MLNIERYFDIGCCIWFVKLRIPFGLVKQATVIPIRLVQYNIPGKVLSITILGFEFNFFKTEHVLNRMNMIQIKLLE